MCLGFIDLVNLINVSSADWTSLGGPLYLPGTSYAQSQMATWNQHTVWFLTHAYNTLLFAFISYGALSRGILRHGPQRPGALLTVTLRLLQSWTTRTPWDCINWWTLCKNFTQFLKQCINITWFIIPLMKVGMINFAIPVNIRWSFDYHWPCWSDIHQRHNFRMTLL